MTPILEDVEEAEAADVVPIDTNKRLSLFELKNPMSVVRKLVTTQRRSSLQRLSSSITNLTEVQGPAVISICPYSYVLYAGHTLYEKQL